MPKITKQFETEVKRVLKIELNDIAEGNTLLLTSMLYGSNPMETHKILDFYSDDSDEMKAARICLALHSDAEFRYRARRLNFFTDNIKAMLNIAILNPLYGARLMPIFCAFATYADDHDVDDELKGEMIAVMEKLRAEMGFAITEITPEGGEIVLADDVKMEGAV